MLIVHSHFFVCYFFYSFFKVHSKIGVHIIQGRALCMGNYSKQNLKPDLCAVLYRFDE